MTAIPNKSDGDVLSAPNLFKFVDETVTRVYVGSPGIASESTLLSMTVPANTVQSGAMINATAIVWSGPHAGSWVKFNLKTGSPTNETTRFTYQTSDNYIPYVVGGMAVPIICFDKAADYTKDVNILVTGQMQALEPVSYLSGAQLIVFGV